MPKERKKIVLWTPIRVENLIKAIKENPKIKAKQVKELDDFKNEDLNVAQIRSKMG